MQTHCVLIMSNFLNNSQIKWLKSEELPKVLRSGYGTEFDNLEVVISDNLWRASYGGRSFVFKFSHSDLDSSLLLKWYLSRCWGFYSLHFLHLSYKSIRKYINVGDCTVDFASVKKHLISLSNSKTITHFYGFKLFVGVLIDHEFPGFSHNDGFELLEILANESSDADKYYELDTKITPEVVGFFRRGVFRSIGSLHEFSKYELLDLALFCTCYETGARPIQLQRMSIDSFDEIHNGYCRLLIPIAKQGKNQPHKKIKVSISEELGIILKRLIFVSGKESKQLFAKDGVFDANYVHIGINNTVRKFAENGLSAEQFPKIYPYDLRHNVAHTLAMSGASAEEISYILGHTTTAVARRYISSTPDIAFLIEKAIGENTAYVSLMAMVLTGDIESNDKKIGYNPAAQINGELHFGIGTCSSSLCSFRPVCDCYGCSYFHPDPNANHAKVQTSLQKEIEQIIEISDHTGQLSRNPLIFEHESRIREVGHVINRCNRISK